MLAQHTTGVAQVGSGRPSPAIGGRQVIRGERMRSGGRGRCRMTTPFNVAVRHHRATARHPFSRRWPSSRTFQKGGLRVALPPGSNAGRANCRKAVLAEGWGGARGQQP